MEVKLPEKVKLEDWGIEVRPYLTLAECKVIADKMCECDDIFERESMLVACVMSACTNFFEVYKDFEYSYEEIVFSDLWGTVVYDTGGIIADEDLSWSIKLIRDEVSRRKSLEGQLETISKSLDPKLIEQIAKAVEDNGSKQ